MCSGYIQYITAVSVRWRHCIDHADTKQKPLMRPDCLLGVVPQPTDSRLSETKVVMTHLSSAAYVGGGRKSRGGPRDVLGQGHACQW